MKERDLKSCLIFSVLKSISSNVLSAVILLKELISVEITLEMVSCKKHLQLVRPLLTIIRVMWGFFNI